MTTEPAVAKARGSARAPERRYEAPAHTDTARSGSAVRCARPGPATPPGRASATSSPAPHRRVVGSRHAGRPRVADPTWCGPPRSALQRWVQRINQRPAERLRRKHPELDCRAVEGGSQCNESATPDRGVECSNLCGCLAVSVAGAFPVARADRDYTLVATGAHGRPTWRTRGRGRHSSRPLTSTRPTSGWSARRTRRDNAPHPG